MCPSEYLQTPSKLTEQKSEKQKSPLPIGHTLRPLPERDTRAEIKVGKIGEEVKGERTKGITPRA